MTTAAAQPRAVANGMSAMEARELLNIPEFRAELTAAERTQLESVARGETLYGTQSVVSAGKALVKLIKKYGPSLYDKAQAAAKRGLSAFKNWARDLSWYHPVRLAVLAAGDAVLRHVISILT
ncbi:hypothetical protein ACFC4C_06960 [Streptomyces sp. NPDC056039]|uniref:hypothetical protein n=1 Tax=Streptomyces sp. NPDC056039 TaxID=3345687 RepID=UPI0035DB56DB